jgi:hypothetical protein
LRERVTHIEKLLGNSDETHIRLDQTQAQQAQLQQEMEARGEHHAARTERVDCVEKLLRDTAWKHSRWEKTHAEQARGVQHMAVQQHVDCLEGMFRDSAVTNVHREDARCGLAAGGVIDAQGFYGKEATNPTSQRPVGEVGVSGREGVGTLPPGASVRRPCTCSRRLSDETGVHRECSCRTRRSWTRATAEGG